MRALSLLPLLLCALSACAGGGRFSSASNRLAAVIMANNYPREGTFEACVWDQVLQGVPVGTAIDRCNELAPAVETGHSVDIPVFLDEGGVAIGTMNCGGLDVDPRARGQGASQGVIDEIQFEMIDTLERMIRAQNQLIGRLDRRSTPDGYSGQPSPGQDNQRATASKRDINESAEYLAYLREMLALARELAETTPSPPGDFPPPDPGGGGVAGTRNEDVSDCERANEFIGECNRDGWRTPQCRDFLSRIKGCADPTLVRTNPDEPSPCGMPAVSPADVKDILLVRCSDRKRYGPDDNPCDARRIVGKQYTYLINPPDNPMQPCGNPYVLTNGEEPCAPAFTLSVFGEVDIQKIAKEGLDKFGGPIFFVPVPQGTPLPGPKPPPTQQGGVHPIKW